MTRTIRAIRSRPNVHERRRRPNRPGLLSPQTACRKTPLRKFSTVMRSSPPTTTTTSVHQGAFVG
jgi:hypothetical protein